MSLPQSIAKHVPEWFSLEKYEPCASMNLKAWKYAIRDRQYISDALVRGENTRWVNGFSRRMELLFGDAVSKLGAVCAPEPKSYPGREWWGNNFFSMGRHVAPLTVESVFSLANCILASKQGKKHKNHLFNNQLPNTYYEAREYWELSATPADNHMYPQKAEEEFWYDDPWVHLEIDLSSSEEDLVKSFVKYVKAMKKEFSMVDEQSTLLRESAFRKYHKHRVLPFLDLTLWFSYKEVSLTYQQLGLILFPNEYDKPLDDRIRRTVKPMADQLMEIDFYEVGF